MGYTSVSLKDRKNKQMKRIIQLSVLVFTLLLCFNVDSYAQYGYGKKKKKKKKTKTEKNDEYFDESGGFAHKLWYGGGFNLGFSGNSFQSLFQLGISPMVGYKITEAFSIGPRASVQYNYFRINDGGRVLKASPITWSAGAFTRYKVLQNFFAHGEIAYQNELVSFNTSGNELIPIRRTRTSYFLGAGYNSGNGILGYEIYLLYNLNLPANLINTSPIDFRIGFTYNF